MWVRAVGVAVAWVAGCWAATAQAAQYTEVWNPPEARHAPKPAKAVTPAPGKALKAAPHAKGKQKTVAAKKGVAHAQVKAKPDSRLAQKSVSKTAAKTASTSVHKTHLKTAARTAANGDLKTAQSKGAHTLTTAHAKPQTLAAKPISAEPALTMGSISTRPATQPSRQVANQTPPR